MKCKNEGCENECAVDNSPKEVLLFSIPFTTYEVRVWDWKKQFYTLCEDCLIDEDNHKHDDVYDRIAEDAYRNGFNDCAKKALEYY